MSSNKRRKVGGATDSPKVSAFAVRERLRRATEEDHRHLVQESSSISGASKPHERHSDTPIVNDTGEISDSSLAPSPASGDKGPSHVVKDTQIIANISDLEKSGDGNVVRIGSDVEDVPSVSKLGNLSNFIITTENHKTQDNGDVLIKLVAGERLVLLGIYEILVLAGRVSILGATLTPSDGLVPVYALSSHALPIIRSVALHGGEAEFCLHHHDTGFDTLGNLSPLFKGLTIPFREQVRKPYRDGSKPERNTRRTFSILTASLDNVGLSPLRPLKVPAEWNALIGSMLAEPAGRAQRPCVMVCGPKSSGKSTFAKLLCNRIISVSSNCLSELKSRSVLYLDLDPGQPEFSTSGQVSLVRVRRPILGPAYTHPKGCHGEFDIIRAHSIYSNSPASDPELYLSCVRNLLSYCKDATVLDDAQAIIINTPGWILGTGLELLMDIIKHSQPTRVIYMSREGPSDVVISLKKVTNPAMFNALPSQASEGSNRTAAQLRMMQAMSYFHLFDKQYDKRQWSHLPLTAVAPWLVKYDGPNSGIFGILCQGEQPPPALLLQRITASTLTVVLVDEISTVSNSTVDTESGQEGEDCSFSMDSIVDGPPAKVQQMRDYQITATPESLPYLQLGRLDPQNSECVGLILLRGVDIESRCLHVLSSIPPETLGDAQSNNKQIILVSGKLDIPGWAYTESLHATSTAVDYPYDDSESSSNEENNDLEDEEVGIGRQNNVVGEEDGGTPYITQLSGHSGRGKAHRVWKVRRDLGRFKQND